MWKIRFANKMISETVDNEAKKQKFGFIKYY